MCFRKNSNVGSNVERSFSTTKNLFTQGLCRQKAYTARVT